MFLSHEDSTRNRAIKRGASKSAAEGANAGSSSGAGSAVLLSGSGSQINKFLESIEYGEPTGKVGTKTTWESKFVNERQLAPSGNSTLTKSSGSSSSVSKILGLYPSSAHCTIREGRLDSTDKYFEGDADCHPLVKWVYVDHCKFVELAPKTIGPFNDSRGLEITCEASSDPLVATPEDPQILMEFVAA